MKILRKDRGLTFDDFELGDQYCSQRRTVTEADVVSFAGLSGDFRGCAVFGTEIMKRGQYHPR